MIDSDREKYEPSDDEITSFVKKWVLNHRRSALSRQPDAVAFLIRTAIRFDYIETLTKCAAKYGDQITPSKSALSRMMREYLEFSNAN